MNSVRFVHSISEAGRLLPSSSRWNSIELGCFNVFPESANHECDSLPVPSRYSRTFDFNLIIADKKLFRRFIFVLVSVIVAFLMIILLLSLLSQRKHIHGYSKDLSSALRKSLVFFDAQKSGHYPRDSSVKFRGDSGLDDGNMATVKANLVGGFYDSGNNMKFSFPTAWTMTLLTWTVIEYHDKYADIHELDHIKNVIRWGSNYLLKLLVPSNTSSSSYILYSQVGSPGKNERKGDDYYKNNDINCWQRPEDMNYPRPVSVCDTNAADLAGEIVAGMSAASIVFQEERDFSLELVKSAELLFNLATNKGEQTGKQGTYTSFDDCGGLARQFYNSSGYKDELIWAGIWLFFATGNTSYLDYATDNFESAEDEEFMSEKDIFSWDNKLSAIAILLTRLRFFRDIGYPYETILRSSTDRTDQLMCSYTSKKSYPKTKGGLILLKPETSAPLQYAATASFLTKLYSDYLELMHRTGSRCGDDSFSVQTLRDFSRSQVMYILGDNPMKTSYMVGFGDKFPTHVHHRSASIPWDGKWHTCEGGENWLNTLQPNPNILTGAMVAGPDKNDMFFDDRTKKWFTEANIWSNAGLVAALVAIHDPPNQSSSDTEEVEDGVRLGIDKFGLFQNIKFVSDTSQVSNRYP